MCRSNFYETGIYSCQLEVKNTFKSHGYILAHIVPEVNICSFFE
jgi:hypothetical protein